MDDELFKRQTGIIDPGRLSFTICVAGAGSVGSWAALGLTKLGCRRVTVVDFDSVELHNVASQFYSKAQIGESKVSALKQNIELIASEEIRPEQDRAEYGLGMKYAEVVVLATDSLSSRSKIFERIDDEGEWKYLIDIRMAGEFIRVLTVTRENEGAIADYRKTLVDKGVHRERCDQRAIVYNSMVSAAMVVLEVKRYANSDHCSRKYSIDLSIPSIL